MRTLRLVIAVAVVGCLLASCSPGPLAPVRLPLPVFGRARPLHDYGDRLLSELSRVAESPDLPASQRVIVAAAPKVELLLLIAGLATDWELYSALWPNGLRSSAAELCRDLVEHDAVRQMKELRKLGFFYDALPKLALCYSDPPAMEQVYPIPAELWYRSQGRGEELRCFMARVAAFAEAVDWSGWWKDHEGAYTKVEEHCRSVCESCDLLGYLEAYFGCHRDALVVVPSAMTSHGFGATLNDPLGVWVVTVFGPMSWDRRLSPESIELTILHEAAHSFVNPLTSALEESVKQTEHLYAPIAARMRALSYGSWGTTLNEHIIRAFGARYCLHTRGGASAASRLKADEDLGFRYIRVVYDQLGVYEAHRDEYPDFESFYPRLLLALRNT